MALFIIRIELQGSPTEAVYDLLHERMQMLRVVRTITGDKGTTPLPHATYSYEGADTLGAYDVAEWLQRHLNTLGTKFKLLVAKTQGWAVTIGWQP